MGRDLGRLEVASIIRPIKVGITCYEIREINMRMCQRSLKVRIYERKFFNNLNWKNLKGMFAAKLDSILLWLGCILHKYSYILLWK